jgi:hypothetical protein
MIVGVMAVIGNEVTSGGNAAGRNGIGSYLDCHCVPSGSHTPGKHATFKLYKGSDSTGVKYGGVVMSEVYPLTGQVLEQYWVLCLPLKALTDYESAVLPRITYAQY